MNGTEDQGRSGSMAYVMVLTGVAAIGGLLFGYDTGVISGAIGYLRTRFALDADMQGWAAASALVGCMIGAGFSGALSLFHLVPLIGSFIVMAVLAFSDWPAGEARRR